MCTGRCVQFHAHQAHSKGSDPRLQAGQAGNQAEEPTVRLDSNPIVYGLNHIGLENFGCTYNECSVVERCSPDTSRYKCSASLEILYELAGISSMS